MRDTVGGSEVVAREDDAKNGIGPRAMTRVIRLFKILAKQRQGLTLTELSQRLEVPKSTLLNSLRPLVNEGYLLTEETRYKLGPSAFRFAASVLAGFSMPDVVGSYVHILANETREAVGFAIPDWRAGRLAFIKTVPSTHAVSYTIVTGISAPLYASAGGRAVLAYAPDDLRESYLSRRFDRLTENTEADPERLREQLKQIRKNGYSSSLGELIDHVGAFAVPVFDGNGALLGALSIAGPVERLQANSEALIKALKIAGRRASGLDDGEHLPS
jgi:DNA-binding IclR family transcriptional regulator